MARRRDRGEGTVRRRSDGRWEGRIALEHGKHKGYYGTTKEEVTRKLREGLKLLSDNRSLPREDIKLARWLVDWLEEAKDLGSKRYSTRLWTYRHVHNHLLPDLGHIALAKLKPADVQAWLNDMAAGRTGSMHGKKASAHLCQSCVRVLSSALSAAEKRGMVTYNAASRRLLNLPGQGDRRAAEIQPLTVNQAGTLIDGIHGDDLEALFLLSLALGLRQGEALGLCWPDLHLDAAQPSADIHQELMWTKEPGDTEGHYELQTLKTERSRRKLELPAFLVSALRIHRDAQTLNRERRERDNNTWGNSWQVVFTTEPGRPLHSSVVTHRFQRKLSALGLPRMRFYDLRHSAASFLAAQGVPVFDIARFLGHTSTQLVSSTYAHWLTEGRQRVAHEMNALLGRPASSHTP